MTYNENGYTKDEIDDLILILDDTRNRLDDYLNDRRADLLIEALEFYKEMNYQ